MYIFNVPPNKFDKWTDQMFCNILVSCNENNPYGLVVNIAANYKAFIHNYIKRFTHDL